MKQSVGSGPAPARWGYKRIRASLYAAAFTAGVMVLLLFTLQLWQSYQATIEAEERNSRNLVRSLESHIERILRENEQLLAGVGDLYLRVSTGGFFDEELFHEYLQESEARLTQIRTLFLLNEQGHVLSSARAFPIPPGMQGKRAGFFPDTELPDRPYFLGSMLDAPAFSRSEEHWSLPAFYKIRDADGVLKGYIAGIIDPAVLNDFLSTLEVGEHGDALIWDQTGRLIAAHPNSRRVVGSYSDYAATGMANEYTGVASLEIGTLTGALEGSQIILSNKSIEGGQIGLVAFLDGRDYLAAWHKSFYVVALTSIVVLSLLFALTTILSRELKHKARDEAALEMAKRQAEQANLAKTHFLAQVSHEFRTPLNAIIGFSEMMKAQINGKQPAEKYLEYADDIFSSGKHLLSVVNDVIDLSRIEAGEFRQNPEEINVGACIDAVLRLLESDAQERDIKTVTPAANATYDLMVDKRLIEQVLINLLSNAVKFSPVGATVRVEVMSDEPGFVDVVIGDQGDGIDSKLIERIGEPFLVGKAEISVEGQGAGLGLSISKRIMQFIGGELLVSSYPGEGTTARMRFPDSMRVRSS